MTPQTGSDGDGSKFDWMGLIRAHARVALIVAGAMAVIVAVVGGAYVKWGQPTQTVASLEFRPTFSTLADLEYPNRLPFSPNDVIAGPIVDLVYDANNIAAPCGREAFRAGFFVEQRSDQSVFLDLEYQARLSEPRITIVERKLLQEEHTAKRKALPLQYRVVFQAPQGCAHLSPVTVSKVLVDLLSTWASESETKRGVLKHQVEVLTPSALDVTGEGPGGLLLRADLLRTVLQRIIRNVEEVGRLPGAVLVRLGPEKLTFAEIQGKLSDLIGSRLDPLVMTSGRSMVKESSLWVAETVATAERRQRGAEQKIQYYQTTLNTYSNNSGAVGATAPKSAPGASGNGAQAPAFDESFINRIVEMSDANTRYRQKLTDALVDAQLEAVLAEEQRASYYRRLLQLGNGPNSAADATDLSARLDAIVAEGKKLTKQFGELYEEFSRVALRSSASMYESRKPVSIETSQQYARRSLFTLVLIVFVAGLVLTYGFFLARTRLKLERR